MAWNFVGGGKAHAMTLHVLGYRCRGETASGFIMHRAPKTISVPKQGRLTDKTVQIILMTCGHSKDEYHEAWNLKIRAKPMLNCPPMNMPPAPKPPSPKS